MLGITWTGTDGSLWDLRGGPVRTSTAGIMGLGLPNITDQTKETALQDGQILTGWRLKPRRVWLPVKFKDAAATDVEGLQRDFWRSMAIGQEGTLTVTDSSGATRSIGLRFQDDGGMAYRLDPYVLSDAVGLTMVADRPWWQGPSLSRSYSLAQAGIKTFFNDGNGATPFYINAAQGSAATTFTNPGDQPAFVTWTAVGPLTNIRFGVDGHFLGGPINVSATSKLVIETDPLRQIAFLDGVKVTRQLTEVDFAPLPSGVNVPISIAVVGTGLVTGTITPRYARAI